MNFIKKSLLEKIFIIFGISIFISINSSITDFDNFNFDFLHIFNFLRYISPLIILFLILTFTFFLKKKIKIPLILKFFLSFGMIQIISFFINGNSLLEFYKYNLVISLFALIFLFNFYLNKNFDLKILYYIYIIILSLVSLSFMFFLLKEILSSNFLNYLLYSNILKPEELNILGQQNPRTSGISRQLVLIISLFLYLLTNIKSGSFFKLSLFLFIFLLSFFVWGLQSRGGLVCLLLLWTTYLFLDNQKISKKIIFFCFLLILPIAVYEAVIKLTAKFETYDKDLKYHSRIFSKEKFKFKTNEPSNKEPGNKIEEIKITEVIDYTSGRINIWKRSYNHFLKKPLIGYGPQGDRIALSVDSTSVKWNKQQSLKDIPYDKQTSYFIAQQHIWDNNCSNALCYSALSGGLLGLSNIIIIYFLVLIYLYKLIFYHRIFYKDDFFAKNSISIIILLLARSFYENSFSVFGLDMVFFLISISYLQFKYLNKI